MLKRPFNFSTVLSAVLTLTLAAGLLFYTSETSEAMRDALTLCAQSIIPALFPFFVLSSLVIELGLAHSLGRAVGPVAGLLFGINSSAAAGLIIGWIGGYPLGAKSTVEMYEKGLISKKEAERLLPVSNAASPAFILGAAGTAVMGSLEAGVILLCCHLAACLIIGIIWGLTARRKGSSVSLERPPVIKTTAPPLSSAIVTSVASALKSMLIVCAFIAFFTVAIRLLYASGLLTIAATALGTALSPLGVDERAARSIITGFFEMSSGVFSLTRTIPVAVRAMAASFILAWGGLSVHFQSLSFISKSGLNTKPYFLGKLFHGLLAAFLAMLVFLLRNDSVEAFSSYVITYDTPNLAALFIWNMVILAVFLLVSLVFLFLDKLNKKR